MSLDAMLHITIVLWGSRRVCCGRAARPAPGNTASCSCYTLRCLAIRSMRQQETTVRLFDSAQRLPSAQQNVSKNLGYKSMSDWPSGRKFLDSTRTGKLCSQSRDRQCPTRCSCEAIVSKNHQILLVNSSFCMCWTRPTPFQCDRQSPQAGLARADSEVAGLCRTRLARSRRYAVGSRADSTARAGDQGGRSRSSPCARVTQPWPSARSRSSLRRS